jgi:thiol-disulfide isomerase/thioredoxin
MLKSIPRTIALIATAALALCVMSVILVHREKSAHWVAPVAASAAPGTRAVDSGSPVIRFVKDPEVAPPLQVRDILGKNVSNADWGGKVVLVNFWATWCPPCREEIPELIELKKQYGDRLQIIGISEDDDGPAKVLKFAQQKGMSYPIVMATPELIASYGGVPALPTSFLVDTQGRVVTKHSGLYPIESYHREIRSLLGMSTDARVETFVDTGQIFLKNAANATELPNVNFTGLDADQKKRALHRMNAETCTCGCGLTISQCRVNDSECPTSMDLAAQIVKDAAHGSKTSSAPVSKGAKSIAH